jgi:hypothetical protein
MIPGLLLLLFFISFYALTFNVGLYQQELVSACYILLVLLYYVGYVYIVMIILFVIFFNVLPIMFSRVQWKNPV